MESKKVLLVDDDNDFINAVSVMVGCHGYETFISNSAAEGFIKAKEVNPDLIILDVNMETESAGFDLNKKMRTDGDLKSVPVIMLTGIDTVSASNQVVDMYRQMAEMQGFESKEVLKVINADGSISVEYKTDTGSNYFLPLDSFVSKPVDFDILLSEINKLIKRKA